MTYEEYLEQNGTLTYRNVGVSMLPLLKQGRDLFTLEKKSEQRCKKYDVVLYRRKQRYILHRIIKVREEDYVILGDNCVNKEFGIRDEDILAVMTSFVRKGKKISCDNKAYKLYSQMIVAVYPLRRCVWKIKIFANKILKSIF